MKRTPAGWACDVPRRGELAALHGGPVVLAGSWWWRAALENHQAACWNAHRDWRTSPPNPICGYTPTERWINHPCEVHLGTKDLVQGRVWSWSAPGSTVAS